MDDVVVQVVPLHNRSTEERVSKLFSSAWVNYEASVIVPYVIVYGVAKYKVLVFVQVFVSYIVERPCYHNKPFPFTTSEHNAGVKLRTCYTFEGF